MTKEQCAMTNRKDSHCPGSPWPGASYWLGRPTDRQPRSRQRASPLLVRVQGCDGANCRGLRELALPGSRHSPLQPEPQGVHDLPQFRHHAGPECIPVLTCQLHRGLIAQGEHLLNRCQGWTDDMARQRGWAPEVG